MPARDKYHPVVVTALEKDGWTITHDPYRIAVGRKSMYVDLAAEKVVAAERHGTKIAVEIKGFDSPSELHDLEVALGQYFLYLPFLQANEPDRALYLAVKDEVYKNLFEEIIGQKLLETYKLKLVVFEPATEEFLKWLPIP